MTLLELTNWHSDQLQQALARSVKYQKQREKLAPSSFGFGYLEGRLSAAKKCVDLHSNAIAVLNGVQKRLDCYKQNA